MVWRFTSPMLSEKDRVLYECPVGAVLREAPYLYDAIAYEGYAESGAFDPSTKPQFLQDAMRVIASERGRMWEISRQRERSKTDAAYGAKALRGGA